MKRRALASLCAAIALAIPGDSPRAARGAAAPWMLVYVGAEDCGPCKTWRRDHRPGFLASAEFGSLDYRELVAPRLKDLLEDETWPAELRAVRSAVTARPGAPQWLVVRDGRVAWSEAGLTAWRQAVWPAIRAAARGE